MDRQRARPVTDLVGAFLVVFLSLCSPEVAASDSPVLDLSLEELLQIKVTCVAKKAQPLQDVAAAIHVLTAEDLRRSGVASIPDALRMVPGLQVARIDASKWAISCRGFNDRFMAASSNS